MRIGWTSWRNGAVVRHVTKLVSGNAVAQLIPLLFMPLLTRLYTPEEFGIYALTLSLASICTVVASMRYDLAIVAAKGDDEAAALTLLSLLLALMVALAGGLLVWLGESWLAVVFSGMGSAEWLYFVPPLIFASGVIQALVALCNRHKAYGLIAWSTVVRSLAANLAMALLFAIGALGMVLGNLLGVVVGAVLLACLYRPSRQLFEHSGKLLQVLAQYRSFPFYSAPSALLDAASVHAINVIIPKFYSSSVLGVFSLASKIVMLPLAFLSGSLSQVLFRELGERHGRGEPLRPMMARTAVILFCIYTPYSVLLIVFAPDVFSFVFGEEWRAAGDVAVWLAMVLVVRGVASPLSNVFAVTGTLHTGALWQLAYFISTLGVVGGAAWWLSFEQLLVVYVGHEVVLYGVYLGLSLWVSGRVREVNSCVA